jgi:SHS2 domain-containing protein
MKKFEVFEHTADVGIRAKGKDVNEAFESAAEGMFSIITDLEKIQPVGEFKIQLKAQDLEQLLVDWLTELLYLHSISQVMFSQFALNIRKEGDLWLLGGYAKGESFDSQKHPYHTEIKAVTHHILQVNLNEICNVQVLFDI